MIRVILADDHAMVRAALKQLIELENDIKVVCQASNGEECLDMLRDVPSDILLLDINMPIMDGLGVLRRMQEKKCNTKVIVLTMHNEPEYIMKVKDLGAVGYVLKDSDADVLIEAIRKVHEGQIYIQREIAEQSYLANFINDPEGQKILRLTSREAEIVKEIAEGLLNREIGDKLHISERTVKNHVSSILKKLELNDRTQVAMFAVKHHIL